MTTIELDVRKVQLVREILNIDNIEVLDEIQKELNIILGETATTKDNTDYICKE